MDEIQIVLPECSQDEVSNLLRALVQAIDGANPGSLHYGLLGGEYGYGADIETPIFRMFPFYWGYCTCGWDRKEEQWCDEHKHAETCYQTGYADIEKQWDSVDQEAEHEAAVKALCAKHDIPYADGYGAAVHCTCGNQKAYEAWRKANDHTAQCPILRHNFVHKPSGVIVDWYKYLGRGMEITAPADFDWRACIRECIASLPPKAP